MPFTIDGGCVVGGHEMWRERWARRPWTLLPGLLFHLAVPQARPSMSPSTAVTQQVQCFPSSVSCRGRGMRLVRPNQGPWEPPVYSQLVGSRGDNIDVGSCVGLSP